MHLERALPMRRALVDEVYDALLELIMDREIEPDARVSIDGLARDLNVSPTPIREALSRLEAEGLVLREARKGFTTAPVLNAQELSELFDVRLLLEPHAARLAARAHPAGRIAELGARLRVMERAAPSTDESARFRSYRDFAANDAAFHLGIAAASGNPFLHDALARLRSHQHLYRLYFRSGLTDETEAEHEAVFRAVSAGDEDAAAGAMRVHLANSRDRFLPRMNG